MYFIYDGKCGFCVYVVRHGLQRFAPAVDYVASQKLPSLIAEAIAPQLGRTPAAAALYRAEDARLWVGYDAFAALLCDADSKLAPLGWPPLKVLGRIGYALVARNRTVISAALGTQKYATHD